MMELHTFRVILGLTHQLNKDIDLGNTNSLYRFYVAVRLWIKLLSKPTDVLTSARVRGFCMFLNPHVCISNMVKKNE